MYKLEITQGNNIVNAVDTDVEVLTQFVNEYIDLFGAETQFIIKRTINNKQEKIYE